MTTPEALMVIGFLGGALVASVYAGFYFWSGSNKELTHQERQELRRATHQ